ncbi:hypothetical protein SSAG_06002 [Streptomyces sp. Mg1]|nr:hypothetical protein SSAG_06002 [Streptomyces sp. Mg1]
MRQAHRLRTELIFPSTPPRTPTILGNPGLLTVRSSASDDGPMARRQRDRISKGEAMHCLLRCHVAS